MSDQLSTAYSGDDAAVVVEPYKVALREIVVFVDGRTEASGILEFAGVLAQRNLQNLAVFQLQMPDLIRRSVLRFEGV